MIRVIQLALLLGLASLLPRPVLTQTVPVLPSVQWHPVEESRWKSELSRIPEGTSAIISQEIYSLPELIDIAETHNPETRVVWERAKQQAAQLGIAHSALYPLLTASALLEQSRHRVLFGTAFFRQDLTIIQPTLSLFYTILDFGSRQASIDAAKANLLAADFLFNETHQRIIFQVTAAYYQLLSAQGQISAAEATLTNSQTVQDAVDARLKNGLATLPDLLEARASTAQAAYELENARGVERVAHGQLSEALGIAPTVTVRIRRLSDVAPPAALTEPVEIAINRALQQRPDLLVQLAQVRAAEAGIKGARSEYFPTVSFSGNVDYQFNHGYQQGNPGVNTRGETWLAQLSARWTLFDGRARYNRLDRAKSEQRQTEAELAARRDRISVEVWTAYSNVQTALRQQESAAALLDASDRSYAAAVEAYQYGVKSFLDVVSAQRVLAQARAADVLARTRALNDFANLAFRTGDLVSSGGAGAKP
jgi:outer membrane protein